MRRALIGMLALLLTGCGVQPTDPINGNRATGVMIYLVQVNSPIPVLRNSRNLGVGGTLDLLAGTPTGAERDKGLTTEVPATAAPMAVSGTTINLQIDPNTLSDNAVLQIVCTAAISGPVVLAGAGQSRRSRACQI